MAQKILIPDPEFTNVYEVGMIADGVTGVPWSSVNPMPVVLTTGPGSSPPLFVYFNYVALHSGTGYTAGDFLQQIEEWDVNVNPAVYMNTIWRNITAETTLPAPPLPGDISPISSSVATVTVSNFPAVQTVAVNNFPSTQAISAASLPLPTGASTVAAQNSQTTILSQIDADIVTQDRPVALGGGSGNATVVASATDYAILTTNTARKLFAFGNNDPVANIWVCFTGLAYSGGTYAGFKVRPGGSILFDESVPTAAMHIASDTAGALYALLEA